MVLTHRIDIKDGDIRRGHEEILNEGCDHMPRFKLRLFQ